MLQKTQPPAGVSTPHHTDRLALHGLGTRHGGTLQNRSRRMTHFLVAVDKFTKWIEARPIKKVDGPTAVRFIKDIVVRYGMPNSIITDDGINFTKGALEQYCSVSGIRLDLASVAYPQSNGQVERSNGLILSGVKPRLVKPLVRSPGS